jgi:hypothetical protein
MKKAALRSTGLVVAASFCMALGAWNASAGEAAGALSQSPKAAPGNSATKCYTARGNSNMVVCYRNSWKAEYRHGQMVYVPILIQVPTPSHPASVTTVDSLNDIHASNTGPGSGPG